MDAHDLSGRRAMSFGAGDGAPMTAALQAAASGRPGPPPSLGATGLSSWPPKVVDDQGGGTGFSPAGSHLASAPRRTFAPRQRPSRRRPEIRRAGVAALEAARGGRGPSGRPIPLDSEPSRRSTAMIRVSSCSAAELYDQADGAGGHSYKSWS
jgi:hypothetical protein